jgi:hypothetical protein
MFHCRTFLTKVFSSLATKMSGPGRFRKKLVFLIRNLGLLILGYGSEKNIYVSTTRKI